VHRATVNRPTGVFKSPTHCLRQRGHCKTLARSTAGSRVWHYNYFRSYSAERGRYTQADPIGLDGGFNRFGYVDGNPLLFVDPLGLAPSESGGGSQSSSEKVSVKLIVKMIQQVKSLAH